MWQYTEEGQFEIKQACLQEEFALQTTESGAMKLKLGALEGVD